MTHAPMKRRAFLGGTALTVLAAAQAGPGRARAGQGTSGADDWTYEITRTEEEWRAMLSPKEFNILRKGQTELPKTNPNWDRDEEGSYACRGCDLTLYDSVWKTQPNKGWAFFLQSRENTVLMGIDGSPPDGMGDENAPPAMIEAHCRRCGSHLGHILTVEGITMHCINGTSLGFQPASA